MNRLSVVVNERNNGVDINSSNFNKLPLFDQVKDGSDDIKEKLVGIGDYIVKNELQSYIGVNLLHRHFKLDDNESLVKECRADKTAYLSPECRLSCDSAIPYLFKFNQSGHMPLEYISVGSVESQRVEESLKRITPHFDNFKHILDNSGLTDSVGIYIRHHEILSNEFTWIETSSGNRGLIIQKHHYSDIDKYEANETNWYFDKKILETEVVCGVCCAVHCGVHCGVHWGDKESDPIPAFK
ncbi:MAG: hypothetical protein RPS47_17935 [Colwellia sp.]|jgi:hypothetical protein